MQSISIQRLAPLHINGPVHTFNLGSGLLHLSVCCVHSHLTCALQHGCLLKVRVLVATYAMTVRPE